MSPLENADAFLEAARFELRKLVEEDPETGEYVDGAGEWAAAALKTIEGARRLLQRAARTGPSGMPSTTEECS